MAKPKPKSDGLRERFKRIRKPVPPPTKIERDRRRDVLDRLDREEAERSRDRNEE